jgi:hypothetical protein
MQTMHPGVVHSQSTKLVRHSYRAAKKLANQLLVDWTVFLAHYWKDSAHFVGASMLAKTADLSDRVQKISFVPVELAVVAHS